MLVCALRGVISFGLTYGLVPMTDALGYALAYGVWVRLFSLVPRIVVQRVDLSCDRRSCRRSWQPSALSSTSSASLCATGAKSMPRTRSRARSLRWDEGRNDRGDNKCSGVPSSPTLRKALQCIVKGVGYLPAAVLIDFLAKASSHMCVTELLRFGRPHESDCMRARRFLEALKLRDYKLRLALSLAPLTSLAHTRSCL